MLNGNGQDMSQGFAIPDGRRQHLCGTPTEAREAEAGQAPDGQIVQETNETTLVQSDER